MEYPPGLFLFFGGVSGISEALGNLGSIGGTIGAVNRYIISSHSLQVVFMLPLARKVPKVVLLPSSKRLWHPTYVPAPHTPA